MTIPLSACDRIIRRNGKLRVSESAARELRKILEEDADIISKKAHDLAEHAGRITVKKEDIKLARK